MRCSTAGDEVLRALIELASIFGSVSKPRRKLVVAEPDFSNNEMRKVVASLQGLAAMNGRLRGSG